MPATFNRMVLAKAETTYATPNAPAGSDALQVGNDLKLNPLQLGLVDRDLLEHPDMARACGRFR